MHSTAFFFRDRPSIPEHSTYAILSGMAFRLAVSGDKRVHFRSVVQSALRQAVHALASESPEGIHIARRNIKRVRAMLRLLRPIITEESYNAVMPRFRDAAHLLSGSRDTQISIEMLQRLARGRIAELAKSAAKLLEDRPSNCDSQTCRKARELLESLRPGLPTWCPRTRKHSIVEKGLQRLARRAQRAYHCARSSPETKSLHEWRKRVKDYGFAVNRLEWLRPAHFGKLGAKLQRLGEALGEEHDLAVMLENVAQVCPEIIVELEPVVGRRREKLQKRAFRIGKAIFK